MPIPTRRANYHLGSLYSLVTAVLVATQEPFSALAARRLSSSYFIFLTQLALLLSVPLLTLPRSSRRDFIALLSNVRNLGRLGILFIIGLCGLLLYYVGLSSAHPIVSAAIFNLSPFWAALVALLISRKPFPVSPYVFFGSFAVAFMGAMMVAWSQLDNSNGRLVRDILENILDHRWSYAIPIPIFFALSGTLVGKWFSGFDKSAAIAANFTVFFDSHPVNSCYFALASSVSCRRTHIASHFTVIAWHVGGSGGRARVLSSGADDNR